MTVFSRGSSGEIVWKDSSGRDKEQYGKPRVEPGQTRSPTWKERIVGAVFWRCYEFLYNKGYENINFHMKFDKEGFTFSGTSTVKGAVTTRLFGQRPKGKFMVWP
jgi:hypothetical protein